MKHRVVHFTDKFENVANDGFINEEFINCDNYDENNGFINEEKVSSGNSEIIDNTYDSRNSNGNIINETNNSGDLYNVNGVERRSPVCTRKPPSHLNDYDLSSGADAVNFIDYCYMLNIPISYENVMIL